MYGLIEYFEPATPAFLPGHVWCDLPIYMPPRQGVKIARVNPNDDTDLDLKVCDKASKQLFDHPPVKSLGIESHEGLVLAKTKSRRPVIILGGAGSIEITPFKQEPAATLFAIPVYGADQYDAGIRKRMANYEFANAFYLPQSADPRFDEGFARLDHAQSVFREQLGDHRGLKLTDDAVDALVEWFMAYSTQREIEGSLIRAYRDEKLAEENNA